MNGDVDSEEDEEEEEEEEDDGQCSRVPFCRSINIKIILNSNKPSHLFVCRRGFISG